MPRTRDNTLRFQTETDIGLRLELMGFLETEPGWKGERHAHAFWELVFTESGRGKLLYGKKEYDIHSGDVFLLEPHADHQFLPDSEVVSRHLYIGFSIGGGFPPWPSNVVPPILDRKDSLEIAGELGEIISRIEQRREKTELDRCAGDVLSVLLKLLSELVSGAEAMDEELSRSAILTKKVKAYLADNLDRNISVTSLAQSFYLSPHYFGDLFKKHAGMTIKEYHNYLRLKESEEMLHDPERQVSEIADVLGYNSLHYFSRKFKQYYGVSPSEFRTQLHQRTATH